jgi:hypothetical protein
MVIAMVATNVLALIIEPGPRPLLFSEWLVSAVPEALVAGLFGWVGMYLGARLAPADRRNGRLVRLVAIAYSALGILFSIPIKTHAVRLDMPSAGDASASQFMPLLIPVALIAVLVLGSAFITRVLAALSGPRIG